MLGGVRRTDQVGTLQGGVAAARGLQYQYLKTIEVLLDVIEDPQSEAVAVHVEGQAPKVEPKDTEPLGVSDSNIVDYEVLDTRERCLEASQIKSSAHGSQGKPIYPHEALSILVRLCETREAQKYQLITNRPLSSGTKDLRALLSAGATAERFASDVQRIANTSSRSAELIRQLDASTKSRLQRARIVVDDSSLENIRLSLRDRLIQVRRRHRSGTGPDGADLLLRSVVTQVLEHASEPRLRRIDIEEFASYIYVEATELEASLGYIDWGIYVGNPPHTPEIARLDYCHKIQDVVGIPSNNNQVQSIVLTGLSGIGKSSIAASYANQWRDAFQYIIWIDASSSETVTASYREAADILGIELHEPEAAAQRVNVALAGMLDRWLVVFDNARESSVYANALPRTGRGALIVTTTDAVSWSRWKPLRVRPLDREDAVQMLQVRLDQTSTSYDTALLERIAEDCARWPLAIEIVASHILGAELTPSELVSYRRSIGRVALDPRIPPPVGYPRTVVKVIDDAIIRLLDSEDDHFAAVTLKVSAYLAATHIPVNTCLVAALLPPESLLDAADRPVILSGFDTEGVMKSFRSVSLANRSPVTLPSGSLSESEAAREFYYAFDLNEIVQQRLRDRVELGGNAGAAFVVSQLSAVLNGWLTYALDAHDWRAAYILTHHSRRVIEHSRRLEVVNKYVPLLYGNTALVLSAHEQYSAAYDLLSAELEYILLLEDGDSMLAFKTRVQLAQLSRLVSRPVVEIIQLATEIQHALENAPALNSDLIEGAITIRSELDHCLRDWPDLDAVLRQSIDEIQDRVANVLGADSGTSFTVTPTLNVRVVLEDINSLIIEDQFVEAVCRARTFADETEDVPGRRQCLALLAEGHAWLNDWTAAEAVIERLREDCESPPKNFQSLYLACRNVGFIGLRICLDGAESGDHLRVLSAVVAILEDKRDSADTHLGLEASATYLMLRALFHVLAGEDSLARDVLNSLTEFAQEYAGSRFVDFAGAEDFLLNELSLSATSRWPHKAGVRRWHSFLLARVAFGPSE